MQIKDYEKHERTVHVFLDQQDIHNILKEAIAKRVGIITSEIIASKITVFLSQKDCGTKGFRDEGEVKFVIPLNIDKKESENGY